MPSKFVTEIARSETLRNVALYAAGISLYAVIPAWLETKSNYEHFIEMPHDLHAAFTLVLGWLLVFLVHAGAVVALRPAPRP